MKKLTLLTFFSLLTILSFNCFDSPVGRKEFRKAHTYLNKRVDTLSRNQKVMIRNQKIIYTNQQRIMDSVRQLQEKLTLMSHQLDSLQSQVHNLEVGQYVIYDAITSPKPSEQSKSNFLNLRNWFAKWKRQK